jgi:hypothetical protein
MAAFIGLTKSSHPRVLEPAASTLIVRSMIPDDPVVHLTGRPTVRWHMESDTLPTGVHILSRVLRVLVVDHATHEVVVVTVRSDAVR